MSDFGFCMLLLVLFILCHGEPDVLDGLMKQANHIKCGALNVVEDK